MFQDNSHTLKLCEPHSLCELLLLPVGKGLTVLPWPKVQPSKSIHEWLIDLLFFLHALQNHLILRFRSHKRVCQSSEETGTRFSGGPLRFTCILDMSWKNMGRIWMWHLFPLIGRLLTWEFPDMWQATIFQFHVNFNYFDAYLTIFYRKKKQQNFI